MSNDYNAGFQAGLRGSIFGPSSAEGTAGFMAGMAARDGQGAGSLEWILAPLVLWPFVLIFYPVGGAATIATAFAGEKITLLMGLGGVPALRWPIVLAAAIVVCWTVVRREQFWGYNRRYYLARHVVRLLILALLINGGATNAVRTGQNLPSLSGLDALFAWPPQWLAIALWLAFWQLFFMRATSWPIYWNAKLISWRFRPKGFTPMEFWRKARPTTVERQAPIEMPRRRL
jgi:hypothetical protein